MNQLQWNSGDSHSNHNKLWQGVFAILVVVALGVFMAPNFLHSSSSGSAGAATTKDGVQEVSMVVSEFGYEPALLTIQSGVPVRWKVDGTKASGCTSVMTIPSLDIVKPLTAGENIIEFTAPTKGQLAFMCSMGMVRGTFNVI